MSRFERFRILNSASHATHLLSDVRRANHVWVFISQTSLWEPGEVPIVWRNSGVFDRWKQQGGARRQDALVHTPQTSNLRLESFPGDAVLGA